MFVYNFFCNVCKYIVLLNWGWGYDFFFDDVSFGVDIERIWLMWNKYCDGVIEFVYMNDIFVRMFDEFGIIFKEVEI